MKENLIKRSVNKKAQSGFTLIEVLIVVLIIGILAAIALPKYQLARDKAKFSTMMDITKALKDANERYYLMYQQYSGDIDNLDISAPYTSVNKYEGYTKINFAWGYCYLMSATYTYCGISVPRVEYITYYDRNGGRRRCDAIKNNERASRLCSAMTGNESYSSNASWNIYYF